MQVILENVVIILDGKRIVRQVSGIFESGTMAAIIGPSGSGKSTLLGAISGRISLHSGKLDIFNDGKSTISNRRVLVDWIHQSSPMLMRRTAIDNAVLSAIMQGMVRDEAFAHAERLMREIGIWQLKSEVAYKLSGGERQRLAVVRCILSGRAIILADEPTASLDIDSRGKVLDALEIAACRGRIVIIATHDKYVADRSSWALSLDRRGG